MTNPSENQGGRSSNPQAIDQREALKQSEKKGAAGQPGSFKDKETDEKIVEIGPDMANSPIKGIDPPSDEGGKRKNDTALRD
jgi:hypothetical protein